EGRDVPPAQELPSALAGLTRRQGMVLRDIGWHDDVSRLIRRLERITLGDAPLEAVPAVQVTPTRSRRRLALIGAIVGAAVIAALVAGPAVGGAGGGGGGGHRFTGPPRGPLALLPAGAPAALPPNSYRG